MKGSLYAPLLLNEIEVVNFNPLQLDTNNSELNEYSSNHFIDLVQFNNFRASTLEGS